MKPKNAQSAAKARHGTGPVTALIGDVVGSRRFSGRERADLQKQLHELLDYLNSRYSDAIVAKFILTEGDLLQALLSKPDKLPDITWDIETRLPLVDIRLGIGFGMIDTELQEFAIGMDGPAFHRARSALTDAKKEKRLGGVFLGFGDFEDSVLNGLARLLRHHRSRFTTQQARVANLLRADVPSSKIASELGVTKQAVSDHKKALAWNDYEEGEQAWRAALGRFAAPQVERQK